MGQRIFEWFHNHTRATSSGTGKCAVLKITRTRKLHPWQAFQKLFYDDQMKRDVDAAFATHLEGVESGKKAKTQFNIMTEMMKQRYENTSKEIKDQCEAYRQKENVKSSTDDPSAKNREYQELVQRIVK